MEKLPGYVFVEEVAKTGHSKVLRAINKESGESYIVKVLNTPLVTETEIARFRQEFKTIKDLNVEGVIKYYELIELDDRYFIIGEDINGISLKKYLKTKVVNMEDFLNMAIVITDALDQIHKNFIIHKDIKTSNIIINRETNIVKISDFGIANGLTKNNEGIYKSEIIEGSLPYMSPEQTGRTNLRQDHRTDIYSLGITFYEVLTGKLPFTSQDPLDIIHSHIALNPQSPKSVRADIPQVINDIIMKMLQKSPDSRYQSCGGISFDLSKCLKLLKETKKIKTFEIATSDISLYFSMPNILVGREHEIDELLSAFDKVMYWDKQKMQIDNKLSRIIFLNGDPGIGKSYLVSEINVPILEKKGYFLKGSYEQFRRDIPYNAIIKALSGYIEQIISEGSEKLIQWRRKINSVLGRNGKILTDFIPKLELLIGKQPEFTELDSEANENRFNSLLKNFIKSLATIDNPLVIFLDDLQWADYSSINLIKQLVLEEDSKYFFIIGAFRDNEVSQMHPLKMMMEELKNQGLEIKDIKLKPLAEKNVNILVNYFMKGNRKNTDKLASLIYQKTSGNPFFAVKFLKSLYEGHLLEFEAEKGWSWNLSDVVQLKAMDNVVDIMVKQILDLGKESQEILKTASCIGNEFSLVILAKLIGRNISEIVLNINTAIRNEFIMESGDKYKFYHDKIQEAVYSMLTKEEQSQIHYKIGKTLIDLCNEESIQVCVLSIVDQLNAGLMHIKSYDEGIEVAKLNLIAAKKTKAATAYDISLKYINIALTLVGKDNWHKEHQLLMELYTNAVEVSYLNTDFDEALNNIKISLKHVRNISEEGDIHYIHLKTLIAKHDLVGVISQGKKYLESMGIKIPKNITTFHILKELLKSKITLSVKKIDDINNLPIMTDPKFLAIIKIIATVGSAAYYTDRKLMIYIFIKTFIVTLRHGYSKFSPFTYIIYSLVLCNLNDIEKAYQIALKAVELLEKTNERDQYAKVHLGINAFIRHWKEPLRNTLPELLNAYHVGLETGDIEYAVFCIMVLAINSLHSGVQLKILVNDTDQYLKDAKKFKQNISLYAIQFNHQAMINLSEDTEDPCKLKGRSFDEDYQIPLFTEQKNANSLSSVYMKKNMLCYIFNDYPQAVSMGDLALDGIKTNASLISYTYFFFYYSLSLLAVIHRENIVGKNRIKRKVKGYSKKIKGWSKFAPMNHLHKFYLIEAELARLEKKYLRAMELYDKSIEFAKKSKFINDAALAQEVAARFYFEIENLSVARHFIKDSYDSYNRWGATTKLKNLEKNYPDIIFSKRNIEISDSESGINDTTTTDSLISEALDIDTVIKLSRTISQEIKLSSLLESVIKLVVINAGGEKGYLILEQRNNEDLHIEVSYNVENDKTMSFNEKIDEREFVPTSVINFVYNTSETLMLDAAWQEGMYKNDPYIKSNKVKSILCVPLVIQKNTIGVIYIENNLVDSVFTPARVELIKIIGVQAAISIENAKWNKLMEFKVEEKTESIKILLDNAGEGYLSFRSDLIINGEYSLECKKIFGMDIKEKNFLSLLNSISESELQFMGKALDTIFDEKDLRKIDIFIGLLISEVKILDRFITLQYKLVDRKVMEYESGRIIMVILNDVTEKRELEQQMESEKSMLKMVVKAVTNYNVLQDTLNSYKKYFEIDIFNLLKSEISFSAKLEILLRSIHTFKGNFGQIYMRTTASNLHNVETEIGDLRKKGEFSNENEIAHFFRKSNMMTHVYEDYEILKNILGEEYFNAGLIVTFSREKITKIENMINEIIPIDNRGDLLNELNSWKSKSIKLLLKPYAEYTYDLGVELDKSIKHFDVEGDDFNIDSEIFKEFIRSLVHIFKNILIHGMEGVDERLGNDKEEHGEVSFLVKKEEKMFTIEISDDGRGIGPELIREKCIEKGILTLDEAKKISDSDILDYIFHDGFSTKNDVDEVGGRGVGLSAVKSETEKLGGIINVESIPGTGTKFIFSFYDENLL